MPTITIKKYVFEALLARTFSVAGRATAQPILHNVLFTAEAQGISIIGSDTELTMYVVSDQVDVAVEGSCLLPPKVYEIVRACPDEDVEFATDGASATVRCAGATWQIKLEQEEYPDVLIEHVCETTIPKEEWLVAINKVRAALTSENLRPIYNFLQMRAGYLRAADGVRLHQVEFPYMLEALVPSRAVGEIVRRLRSMSLENVEFGEVDRHYTFKFDDDLLIVSKYNVQYPDLDTAMVGPSQHYDLDVVMDRKSFIAAIQRVAITVDEDTNYLSLSFTDNRLVLSTLDKFGNQAVEELDIYYPHPPQEIGLNQVYLTHLLTAMSQPQVRILFPSQRQRDASLRFEEENFMGILIQLRPDLGDAAKGSDRVRPAQMAPEGWGYEGSMQDDVLDEQGQTRRRRRGRASVTPSIVDAPTVVPDADDLDPEQIGSIIDDDDD